MADDADVKKQKEESEEKEDDNTKGHDDDADAETQEQEKEQEMEKKKEKEKEKEQAAGGGGGGGSGGGGGAPSGEKQTLNATQKLFESLIIPSEYVTKNPKFDSADKESNEPAYLFQPLPESVTPLLIFINKRAGGQAGGKVLGKFQKYFGAHQIFDLKDGGPRPGLITYCGRVPRTRILACGGDGTAGWVLFELDKLALTDPPPVAVLPLGTGNDLSRVLGWGPGYSGEKSAVIFGKLLKGQVAPMDRWDVAIGDAVDAAAPTAFAAPVKKHVMNNYFSIGVDAKIALAFHQEREAHPGRFTSRAGNKAVYARKGTSAIFNGVKHLDRLIKLEVDGAVIVIPPIAESLIMGNIPSYGGGTNLWGTYKDKAFGPGDMADQALEIVAPTGPVQLALARSHLAHPRRIAQGKDITITFLQPTDIPVQVDGEPWSQPPAVIHITHRTQSPMLVYKKK